MSVGIQIVGSRDIIQSYGGAKGGEELGGEMYTDIGQNKFGQTVGHNTTVQQGFGTLRLLYLVYGNHPEDL